jgi:hypothetical protein
MQINTLKIRPFSFRSAVWLNLTLLVLTGVSSARGKKDVLVFANGDRITCEIVKMQKGYLYVKLDYGDGTVSIDWSKVVRIESPQIFVIADENGDRYTGELKSVPGDTTAKGLEVEVRDSSTSKIVPRREIVDIEQTDLNFWQNLHGSVDAGFNYTKQQSRTQYSFDSNVIYRRPKWSVSAQDSSSFSGGGSGSSLRNDLLFQGIRQLKTRRNFYMGLAEFQHNSEQELALRTTLGGALGHNFRMTNNSLIAAYGGFDWNQESYFDQADTTQGGNSAEAIVGSQLNFFKFKTTNFFVDTRVFPSLTDLGRVRFDLNTSVKLKIAKDLYWNFSYYLTVDSRPPQDLPQTDYGSSSSLGWTF